ncbi:MAG: 30S ribosomal protein S6 [Oscillospiraceae bacterium]|jgi:small subunit ribosomal protein S6|nr:30S ribosomal protein S6 [Oscillospiraceae bacterium]
MSKYESILVVSVKAGEEAVNGVVTKFKDLITANSVPESVTVDAWGNRRLAYPINKENEGHYVLYSFETEDADFTAELDRVYKITDGVLRSLIIKKED